MVLAKMVLPRVELPELPAEWVLLQTLKMEPKKKLSFVIFSLPLLPAPLSPSAHVCT
jgi:hypothetical protein